MVGPVPELPQPEVLNTQELLISNCFKFETCQVRSKQPRRVTSRPTSETSKTMQQPEVARGMSDQGRLQALQRFRTSLRSYNPTMNLSQAVSRPLLDHFKAP